MNGVPMKLDYSKTLNEQLGTFNYYRNRYASYELELMQDRQQIDQLTNNWNELEEWLEERHRWEEYDRVEQDIMDTILDKMKEIKEKEY